MKNIILFGIGENGRKMIDAYIKHDVRFEIVAIADNHCGLKEYMGIPVIRAEKIFDFIYDEIWICTIYYEEIKKQLVEECHIEPDLIRYVEYPAPFLVQSLYEKYEHEIKGDRKCESKELQQVIDYIAENRMGMYCYPFFEEYQKREFPVFYDQEQGLYYGIFTGHKMYLSKKFDNRLKAGNYFRFTCMEQDKRSPHCYFAGNFKVESGSVGIDVGAAEGIFALEVIDRVKHIYLIEADKDWCDALALTFEPYREKVTIINGFVSDGKTQGQDSLDFLFSDKKVDFIKMDIEGAEEEALLGAEKIIERDMPMLAVCTYHHALDNHKTGRWLLKKGYTVKNSEGYVVCQGEWELDNLADVDFRRALLWAERA